MNAIAPFAGLSVGVSAAIPGCAVKRIAVSSAVSTDGAGAAACSTGAAGAAACSTGALPKIARASVADIDVSNAKYEAKSLRPWASGAVVIALMRSRSPVTDAADATTTGTSACDAVGAVAGAVAGVFGTVMSSSFPDSSKNDNN